MTYGERASFRSLGKPARARYPARTPQHLRSRNTVTSLYMAFGLKTLVHEQAMASIKPTRAIVLCPSRRLGWSSTPNYDRTMIVASAFVRTIGLYRQRNLHEKCLSGGIWSEPSGTRTRDPVIKSHLLVKARTQGELSLWERIEPCRPKARQFRVLFEMRNFFVAPGVRISLAPPTSLRFQAISGEVRELPVCGSDLHQPSAPENVSRPDRPSILRELSRSGRAGLRQL